MKIGWKDHRRHPEVSTLALKFHVGDIVHAIDDGEVGVISYARRDGQCCVTWPSGRHEWVSQDALCGMMEKIHHADGEHHE